MCPSSSVTSRPFNNNLYMHIHNKLSRIHRVPPSRTRVSLILNHNHNYSCSRLIPEVNLRYLFCCTSTHLFAAVVAAHVRRWSSVLVPAARSRVDYGVVVAVGGHRSRGVHRRTTWGVAFRILGGAVQGVPGGKLVLVITTCTLSII